MNETCLTTHLSVAAEKEREKERESVCMSVRVRCVVCAHLIGSAVETRNVALFDMSVIAAVHIF